jgi:hypothetical protein
MVFDSRHEAPSTSHLQDKALFLIVFHFIDWSLLAGYRRMSSGSEPDFILT